MARLISLIFSLVVLALPALAQQAIPDRRLTVERDTDFFGSDLQSLFDTTYEVCRATCLADPQCRAFTYNTLSNACFPKSTVTDRQPYRGAVSAEITDQSPEMLARAQQRQGELTFLTPEDFDAARSEALDLPARHAGTGQDAIALVQAARAARENGNPLAALRFTGTALGQSDAADLWVAYAALALNAETRDDDQRSLYRAQALAGAINGYLRAGTVPGQIAALSIMADALERVGRGRDMIPALRLAQSLAFDAETAARLDRAIGTFGFRITDSTVDSDAASPRICAQFSEDLVQAGVDYASFVQTDAQGLAIQPEGSQLCLDGVEHGARYRVTFRQGLPAASGEALAKSVTATLYVRDRAPLVRFPGRGYVLPAGGAVAVPVETVNLSQIDLVLRRVSERNLIRTIQDRIFGQPIPSYRQSEFATDMSREIWRGTGAVQSDLNRDMTTRLPLGEVAGDLSTGIYALQASIPDAATPPATQWFIVSDIGLSTLSGSDGLHVFSRALSSAEPRPGITLTLLSRANAELATATTDADGHAIFAPGLVRGTGGAAPAMLIARDGDADMAFLPLTDPEFDLSDRGVEGRAPAGPMDAFLTTDRGAYRAGDTIHATALLRDPRARAIADIPVTAILYRPDGVEYARHLSPDGVAGGHVFDLPTGRDVARGTWRLELHADPDTPALASQTFLIEDFVPERIDATLTLPDGPLSRTDPGTLVIDARYLFGAPGADLGVAARATLSPADTLAAFPGYVFGRHDAAPRPVTETLAPATTDATGRATIALRLPETDVADRPLIARITAQISEGAGRPIERSITRPVTPDTAMIGIRPAFDGVLPENTEARFALIAAGATAPIPVEWTVNRVERRYQWYTMNGNWQWEPVTRRTRIASGAAELTATPLTVAANVDWGQHEIVVESVGGTYAVSSVEFSAGWYAEASVRDTPDMLELSLDRSSYGIGDTATLRLVPRMAGKALVTVLSDRLVDRVMVDVAAGENTVELAVTDDWGPGAYVTATVFHPADAASQTAPARALGLAHAGVDPGAAQLSARFDIPAEAQPRATLEVALNVDGIAPGDTAWATIAAVDLGILNLTGFDAPDPSGHYFGQRRLGVGLRDLYGRLIDGNAGAMGRVRSGGDAAGGMTLQSPPPTEVPLALFRGPVEVGADGTARTTLDLPAFNGTVRLMAVVWSDTGVGQANADILVRDPIVATATLPRFLAPGDTSRILLDLTHATGPTGDVGLSISAEGVTLDTAALPAAITLDDGERQSLTIPVTADDPGDHDITLTLTTPAGETLGRTLVLPVRLNDPETQTTRRLALAPGDTFTLNADIFANLRPGSGTATLTAGPLARFDTPGLLESLNRYPYGCTEQVTSRALPLLYLPDVARALDRDRPDIATQIEQAVTQILGNQSPNGSFGLWQPGAGDFWLDAYVTDFLSRARTQGMDVPDIAFRQALDNLRNRVNAAPDFERGGEDIAYALHVLAREGAAAIGDLRYYADVKSDALATPLAVAQLGAALAAYGDPARADTLFAQADRMLAQPDTTPEREWRADYGTPLRDRAAVLTLASEAGSTAIDRPRLIDALVPLSGAGPLSPQEAAWSLLATDAIVDTPETSLTIDGIPATGPLIRRHDTQTAPVAIVNAGATDATLTLTTFGVPDTPAPKGGNGYAIERRYFTLDGTPTAADAIAMGTRLVAVLTVQPFATANARLMVDDPLPAGFEIDNPNLLRSGDVGALDWLDTLADTENTEFRTDRMLAAVNWRSDDAFRLAYILRATSPGTFHHPAASVEDMYRPRYRARTETGRITVTP